MPTRTARHALLAFAVFAAAGGGAQIAGVPLAPAAFAQVATVTLDNHVIKPKPETTITLKRVEVTKTNLSRDEVIKLLAPETSNEERTAIAKRMKAERFAIPSAEVKAKNGVSTLTDFVATNIDSGKLAKAGIASFQGSGTDNKDKPISIKSGPITLEDADLSGVATALSTGDPTGLQARLGRFSWSGFDMTFTEEGPKDKAGQIRIAIASVDMKNAYEGEVFKNGVTTLKNLVIEPSKGSKMERDLSPFGYSRLDLGMNISAAYDQAKKALTVDDWTIDGAGMGALTLKTALGSIDKGLFSADKNQQLAALIGGDVSRLELKFANAGLVDRALAYVGEQQKKSPADLRKEWGGMVGQMLPAVLGGDPSALALAGEVQKFIADSKNLTIAATGKAGPVKFIDLAGIKNPQALLQKVKLEAAANK
ncbi:MAG: hypothetical protein IPL88_11910 [Rhizobiales bacterium]|nr:hypothetical protein [Hyphomicrobiales bacterium]